MADISKITLGETTYDLKDSNAKHSVTTTTTTVLPISSLATYTATAIGATNLTSTSITDDYCLDLTGALNSLTTTSNAPITISNLSDNGQSVVTSVSAS